MTEIKPVYLLAGGRGSTSPDRILKEIFKDIGKPSPKIAYVGVATDDNTEFFQRMTSMISAAGACTLTHALIAPKNADLDKARDVMLQADAIYVGGGDVEAGMAVLNKKKFTKIFNDLFIEGKLFFGVSAGSIMLGKEWVHWRDPDDDSTAELFPCLGIAPVVCDTHGEADYWEELQAAVSLEPEGFLGYGITSGSCLKVAANGRTEALVVPITRYIHAGDAVRRETDLVPPTKK
jgi:peptidase E